MAAGCLPPGGGLDCRAVPVRVNTALGRRRRDDDAVPRFAEQRPRAETPALRRLEEPRHLVFLRIICMMRRAKINLGGSYRVKMILSEIILKMEEVAKNNFNSTIS